MRNWLLTILLLFPFNSFADLYLGLGGGLSSLRTTNLDRYNVNPNGTALTGFVGIRKEGIAFEMFYTKAMNEGKLIHDGTEYKTTQDDSIMGVAAKLHSGILFLKAGYAFHSLSQSVTQNGQAVSNTRINSIYDIEAESRKSSAAFFGVGLQKQFFKSMRVFADYSYLPIKNPEGSVNTITAGIIFLLPDIKN
jgi:hypothetical protein